MALLMGEDKDELRHHIYLAIRELKDDDSHEAAICEDRLHEAMMWASRMRFKSSHGKRREASDDE